jgi:hypothetical protein
MNVRIGELVVSDYDQARIDGVFLSLVIDRLNATDNLALPPDTCVEVEAILERTLDRAHASLMEREEISPETFQNLAKLSFVDTLDIATGQKVKFTAPEDVRAEEGLSKFKRLFASTDHNKRAVFGRVINS